MRDRQTARNWWREAALSFGALIGTICIIAAISAVAFDVKPLVFRSGSMSPAIETGALGLARTVAATELGPGDVVSVRSDAGVRVTHRVVATRLTGNSAQLTLKGDANEAPDATSYVVTSADRVFFDVPYAGYVVAWGSSPLGIFAGGALLALVVLASAPDRGQRSRRARGGKRKTGVAVAVLAVGSAAVGPLRAVPTQAAWTDTSTAASAFSTHTVRPPTAVACSGGGLLAPLTFTWPNKDIRYQYVVTLERPAGTVVRTDLIANNGVANTDQSLVYNFTLLNGLVGLPATFTVRVKSRLTSATSWISSGSVTDTGSTLSLGLLGLTSSC